MFTAATQFKYVSDLVLLPTYAVVAVLGYEVFGSGPLAALAVIATLFLSRVIMEIFFRFVFGDARLRWHVGAIAFASQIAVWGALWAWHTQWGAA